MRWGFELLVFAIGVVAAHDAWRSEARWRATLGGALVYALVFEWIVTTQATGGFVYGRFAVHGPGGAPLWVPIGWACLIYAAMRTSDRLGARGALAVALDASLVAAVGWLLDPVALALGWWGWSSPGDEVVFGAPVGNFLAWLLVGAAFSGCLRALRGRLSPWIAVGLSIPLALGAVAAASAAAQQVGATWALVVGELVAGAGALVAMVRARPHLPARATVVAIPAMTTLGVFAVALLGGVVADSPRIGGIVFAAGAAATLPHLVRARPRAG